LSVARRAFVEDAERLIALERGCAGAPHWSEAVWKDILRGGVVERAVVVVEGAELQGFVVVSRVGEVADLESIGVAEHARRRGLARVLCLEAMRWARAQGAVAMELEVRAGNQAALGLYAGLGFLVQGRRLGYYRNPVEEAVLMRRELGGDSIDT
jgi:ribosomal-protein-alanine N-acetyltransferase